MNILSSPQQISRAIGLYWHKRRWARRNIHKLVGADTVIVSHTKSGRTWLRVMISYLYHLEYGIPANELVDFDNLHRLNTAVPKIYLHRDTRVRTFKNQDDYVRVRPDQKCLFMVRDPRDVAVSFHFHVRNRTSERELIRKGIALNAGELSLYDFVVSEDVGIPRVIEHYNRWHREMQDLEKTLVIRYEQMREDTAAVLDEVMRFIDDHPFTPERITASVEFAAFENLAKKEASGFFAGGRLRPTDPGDTGSFKVRRGKVGGYRDYFSAEQLDVIDALVRDRLDPFYGYR